MTAPWKALLELSLKRNERIRHSRYIQLATVRPDGRPANRSVVYRGFLADTDRITFVTDLRSRKVEEISHQPWAEVAWYFPETREQFRIFGRVSIVTKDSEDVDSKFVRARRAAWKNMSDSGRQQFTWPQPGLPRGTGEEEESSSDRFSCPAPCKDDPVADPFCLCYMDVAEVDHLSLKTNQRRMYRRSGDGWEETEVNP